MDAISRLIKVQIPGYLRGLPIPGSVDGLVQLSGKEWVQLVPVVVTASVVVYLVVNAFSPKKKDIVNPAIEKDKEKVANVVDIEDLGDKGVFCRCWRSKKVSCTNKSHKLCYLQYLST